MGTDYNYLGKRQVESRSSNRTKNSALTSDVVDSSRDESSYYDVNNPDSSSDEESHEFSGDEDKNEPINENSE